MARAYAEGRGRRTGCRAGGRKWPSAPIRRDGVVGLHACPKSRRFSFDARSRYHFCPARKWEPRITLRLGRTEESLPAGYVKFTGTMRPWCNGSTRAFQAFSEGFESLRPLQFTWWWSLSLLIIWASSGPALQTIIPADRASERGRLLPGYGVGRYHGREPVCASDVTAA